MYEPGDGRSIEGLQTYQLGSREYEVGRTEQRRIWVHPGSTQLDKPRIIAVEYVCGNNLALRLVSISSMSSGK